MSNFQTVFEEIKVLGSELVDKVRELVHEGNVSRIIIKNEAGQTIVEMPMTLAAVGAVLAPVVAVASAIATVVTKCTVVVEKRVPVDNPPAQERPSAEPPPPVV
jgi:hypothetical protein